MKNTITRLFKMIMFAGTVSIIAVGCVSQNPSQVADNCPLPGGHLIDKAFETAKSTLSNPECRYKFDAVLASLLTICEGAPDMKNKESFSELFLWAKDEGVISKVQAKEYYTRYFSRRFVSLPGTYQTCSHCLRLKTLVGECRDEVKNKEQGLLRVCNDKSTYAKACDDLQKIELILEATCTACAAE
jgi:hypothetical protein